MCFIIMCFIQIMKLCDWIPGNINSIYNSVSHLFPSLPCSGPQSIFIPQRHLHNGADGVAMCRHEDRLALLQRWGNGLFPVRHHLARWQGQNPCNAMVNHSKMLGNMDVRPL